MKTRIIRTGTIAAAVMLTAVLWLPAKVFAVSTVTISPAGNGVFLIQGTAIEAASAIEITVAYDAAELANPRFTEGPLIAGAMKAVNPNVPGIIRMAVIRIAPISGSGVIATLTFDRTGPSGGKILSLSARFANARGAPLPTQVQVNRHSDASMTTPEPLHDTVAGPGAPAVPTIAPMIILAGQPETPGEATANTDMQGETKTADRPVPQEPDQEPHKEPVSSAKQNSVADETGDDAPTTDTTKKQEIYAQQSILDRFREYTGKRSVEAFLSLFEQEGVSWCRQDPPVALSDGGTVVRVTFITTPGNKTTSDVAVVGAYMISLKKDPDNTNTWIVDLLPEQGESQAGIAVSQGNVTVIYPLTIAPKVAMERSSAGIQSTADLGRYLAARGGSDVNRDGRRDYVDDYILTANYLAARGTASGRKTN